MVKGIDRRLRSNAGGIKSLARLIDSHGGALEYDLLTRTGHDIDDIGRTLSWGALYSFVKNLGPDSALAREMYPEEARWASIVKTNAILADIYDAIMMQTSIIIALRTGKQPKEPTPYPRPGNKAKKENEKHFGSGAMPANELHEWFKKKRLEHEQQRND